MTGADSLRGTAFLAALLGLLLTAVPARAATTDRRPSDTEVTAVIPYDAPPTYFFDSRTGKPAGFAVDIMDKLAERAGLHINYLFAHNWSEIISKVRNGEADLIPNIGLTEGRKKYLAFSSPVDTVPISYFVRSQTKWTGYSTAGRTVGVILGSAAYEKLSENPNMRFVAYESFQQGLFDLLAGKIDAFACPAPTLLRLARESKVDDRIKPVGEPIAELKRAVAVRKDNTRLLKRMNAAIEGFVGGPEYRDIYTRWYGMPAPYWNEHRILTAGAFVIFGLVCGMLAFRYITILRFNRRLLAEIEKRGQAEESLRKARESLEQRVEERTFELGMANEELEHEIAERTKAEEALRESESRYHTLFEQSPDGILLIDTFGKVLDFNETAHRQLGYSREEFALLSLSDIDPVESPEEIRGKIEKILEAGRAELDVKHRTKQGEVRDVHIIAQVIRLSDAPVLHAIWHDVTERRRTEKALIENEKFLQTVIETEPACIKLLDENGALLQMNRAGLSMIGADSLEQMKGKCVYPLVTPEYREAFKTLTESIFLGTSGTLEFEVIGLKGRPIMLETHAVPLRDESDRIIALLGITLDITERKQAEGKILSSLKEKEILLREIHHRVKNNLNVIISLLRLQSRYITEPALLHVFQDCQNRIRSMALIHERLYQTKDFTGVNYKEYIDALITDISTSHINVKGRIRITKNVQDIFLDLEAAIPCGLIINELVTNALKYAFPGNRSGEITVGLAFEGDKYVLSVGDDGIGLPEGFDLRSSKTLGVQLVGILVKQLGGNLRVTADKGSEFVIAFSGKTTRKNRI